MKQQDFYCGICHNKGLFLFLKSFGKYYNRDAKKSKKRRMRYRMITFRKKDPLIKEMEYLKKQEIRFLNKRKEKKETKLNQFLKEKVPDKLQDTLDGAFAKAFALIFEKGTGVIEKTYQKEKAEARFLANEYENSKKNSRRTLKAFSKKAGNTGKKNLLLSGVSGVGLGVLGIGIPDIFVFTAMILKNIYEIALNYGYNYEAEEERYFILLLIKGAVSYGDEMEMIDHEINSYIENETMPDDYSQEEQIKKTSAGLSKELLYMKFLQGIPVAGAIGGAYDVIYMKQISDYADLKYRRRLYFSLKKEQM